MKNLKKYDCYTLLSDVFELEEVIDIVERLVLCTEENLDEYGIDPLKDEDSIDGRKLLNVLKNCR